MTNQTTQSLDARLEPAARPADAPTLAPAAAGNASPPALEGAVPAQQASGAPPGIQIADLSKYLAAAGVIPAQPTDEERAAEARAQRMLVLGLIAVVFVVHLPWIAYLAVTHGCWGGFLEGCLAQDGAGDSPFLFARIAFGILRVQSVLAVDVAKFSELMQLSTGVGAFLLARIAAANGQIVAAGPRRFALAGVCALCFVLLFWAELHLTGSTTYPVLGDLTVLQYIDFETPLDIPPGDVEPGLLRYLQILRLADAMIFGAALALLKPPKAKR